MMYKVGDVVKVIVNREKLKDEVKRLAGELVTIDKVMDGIDKVGMYKIKEDGGAYIWRHRYFADPDFLTEPCQKTKEHISIDSLME